MCVFQEHIVNHVYYVCGSEVGISLESGAVRADTNSPSTQLFETMVP